MSEQSPETPQRDEPEVEGHRAALTEDPSAIRDEEDGPEVEGHVRAFKPEDPSFKG